MPTLNNVLNIGLSGLKSNQVGLNVTGQNIANINTEGYTRQQLVLESAKQIVVGNQAYGTGVNLQAIARFRDAFIDRQFREENETMGSLEKQAESMDLIEGILNEPSDSGLHEMIKNFFNSLQDLTTNPESSSVRTTVREQGRSLARMFNQVWSQLETVRDNKNFEIIDRVSNANEILDNIGVLNVEISGTETMGRKANDLRDSRDQLLDRLSRIVDMTAYEDPENGSVTVSIEGRNFVTLNHVVHLEAEASENDNELLFQVINTTDKEVVKFSSGELHGLFEVRDNRIPRLQTRIDELAQAIINKINDVHRKGYGIQGGRSSLPTGIDFFQGDDAASMKLSSQLESDPNNIAASKTGAPGDNSNALEMAQLRNKGVLNENSFSFEDYLGSLVSSLGLETVNIKERLDNQDRMVQHLKNFRESIIGVNLDEELINMIRYQKAFGANARMLSTVNEMMEVVVQLGRY
ncbi:MAG: flagellar hook-associated protein FlgK [Gemmatimonadota bacterium]|nr:flagellar hook-associated protein FlgK [Gemmatimonadota bacterium]